MKDDFSNYGVSPSSSQPEEPSVKQPDDKFGDYKASPHEVLSPEPPPQQGQDSPTDITQPIRQNPLAKVDTIFEELDRLVGLNRVKSELRTLIHFVHIQELRRIEGISTTTPALHSVFYGSPGTGKTTVARLYGQMLCSMGLLTSGHLVETDRSGLVGGYIGQTANKTDEKIAEALGGVLFIDEAYSLSRGEGAQWDYGSEAIEILMKRMEDHRSNIVVIAAGYPEPMEKFLSSNEGLRSRFSTFILFEDYSPEELFTIFKELAIREVFQPTMEALDLVFASIDYNYSIRDKSFGNARFVRNLFETIIRNQALRLSTISGPLLKDQLQIILPEDVPFITPSDAKPKRSLPTTLDQTEEQQ